MEVLGQAEHGVIESKAQRCFAISGWLEKVSIMTWDEMNGIANGVSPSRILEKSRDGKWV